MSDDEDTDITFKEAAFRLCISENAMRIRRSRKTLPVTVHSKGGRLYINAEEIEVFYRLGGWDYFKKNKWNLGNEKLTIVSRWLECRCRTENNKEGRE